MIDADLTRDLRELLATPADLRDVFGPGWSELTGRPLLRLIRGNGPRRPRQALRSKRRRVASVRKVAS